MSVKPLMAVSGVSHQSQNQSDGSISLNMPGDVLGKTRNGSYVKTTHRNGKGTVTTLAFVSPDVPGGVVSHSSKEVDKNGRLVRRTTLKLTEYSADPDKDRSGPFARKRARRDRNKPNPH